MGDGCRQVGREKKGDKILIMGEDKFTTFKCLFL